MGPAPIRREVVESEVLKRHNRRTTFYTVNNIKSLLSRLKDHLPLRDNNGVYELRCSDCPATYIGQTARSLSIRVNEHIKAA